MLDFFFNSEDISRSGKLISSIVQWGRGAVFCCLWCGSICSGFLLLYCPLLPLLFFHQRLFRRLTDIIFAAWEIYPAALLECILGTKIVVTGDYILPQEASLLVMNHRTRLDWNFLWAAMFHACQPMAHRLKFVLKASIRHLPGPGWVMQMACFLYIHRRWERDKALLSRTLDYFRDIGHTYQILIFPEGTDLNIGSQEKSHNFASTHNLQRYYRVLHPKTTGFVFLAQRMKENGQLDAIYDITVGYPRTLPQSEVDLARGIFPEEVHLNIRRFPGNSIPSEEEAMKQWLETIWKQKEETLGHFYSRGYFLSDTNAPCSNNLKENFSSNHSKINIDSNIMVLPNSLQNSSQSENFQPNYMHRVLNYSNGFGHSTCRRNVGLFSNQPFHSNALYLALMFWTLLCVLALYSILMIYVVQIFAIINITFFVFVIVH